jgi:hypothetical protein
MKEQVNAPSSIIQGHNTWGFQAFYEQLIYWQMTIVGRCISVKHLPSYQMTTIFFLKYLLDGLLNKGFQVVIKFWYI